MFEIKNHIPASVPNVTSCENLPSTVAGIEGLTSIPLVTSNAGKSWSEMWVWGGLICQQMCFNEDTNTAFQRERNSTFCPPSTLLLLIDVMLGEATEVSLVT